jgi:hypothetical protein
MPASSMSRAGQHQSGTSDEPRRQAGAGVRVETAPWHSVAGGALCGGPCADYDAVDAARRADRVQGVDRQLGLLASTQPGACGIIGRLALDLREHRVIPELLVGLSQDGACKLGE